MSGPSNPSALQVGVLMLIGAVCSVLPAQYLPDIGEFEVEDVRLILLDAEGKRRGVLKGDLARKQRDGNIVIEQAVLSFVRERDRFEITAAEFIYEPDTSRFKAPEGITAALPRDGLLVLPAGEGEISYGETIEFRMDVDGAGELRTGPEGSELANANVVNPKIHVEFASDETDFELKEIRVEGSRGGTLQLRLAHLPGFTEHADEGGPGRVNVSCFGNLALVIHDNGDKARLSMQRRAAMKLIEDGQRTFEVTSSELEIRGSIVSARDGERRGDDGESLAASLTDLAIDASQNVRMIGDEFSGTAGVLRYREFMNRREVRLESDPQLNLRQGEDENGTPRTVNLRAREYVDVMVPVEDSGTMPDTISVELRESARVERFAGEHQEWKITGRMVRLFSWRADEQSEDYNHAFDAYAEGFSPLLRVNPSQTTQAGRDVERAAVYGSRAEGTFVERHMGVRVYGREILAVVDSDIPLAEQFRVILGLQAVDRDASGSVQAPDARDGRLTVRAESVLDVDLMTDSASGDLDIAARGNVRLDHQPLPRDDRNLLTLTGDELDLRVTGGEIERARLDGAGPGALATLGYDLLEARIIDISAVSGGLRTDVAGPGRIVVRDESSVDYFRRELDRLPKRVNQPGEFPEPDAAWLNFGATLSIRTRGLDRRLEGDTPDFHLVFGGFEAPRAGRSAVDDLAELFDPEVQTLYIIRARRMFASQFIPAPGGVPVNTLRLEGDPLVDSSLDGIRATAVDAIELGGSENQRSTDAPFSITLMRDARVSVDEAGVFFGDYVQSGVFSYDDAWVLSARGRLEITMRPLEAGRDGRTLADVRGLISEALPGHEPAALRVHKLVEARRTLEAIVDLDTDSTDPTVLEPINALPELDAAIRHARRATAFQAMHNDARTREFALMVDAARRARTLLSSLIDVAGRGGVHGRFTSKRTSVPPMGLRMRNALFTFNGLGNVVDVEADGPIEVVRANYVIRGDSLTHEPGGTLTLDGASITLPADTGVKVEGVRRISLKQREEATIGELGDTRRTMVTRVTGRKLEVDVDITTQGQGRPGE